MTDLSKSVMEELDRLNERCEEIQAQIAGRKAQISEQATTQGLSVEDSQLIQDCLNVLEYATYHDGRYGQTVDYAKFQHPAQKLVARLAKRLNVKPYASATPDSLHGLQQND